MLSRQVPATLLSVVAGLLMASPAGALTLTTTATTMVAGRADPRDGTLHTVLPFLEAVSLRAYDFQSARILDAQVVLSGWGQLVAGSPRDDKTYLGDLDLAYGEGSIFKRRLFARVGRQFVVPGAASLLHLDGVDASLSLPFRFGVSGFAGAPVSPRFGYDLGDFATGVRTFYRHSVETEVGVSYVFMYGHQTILRRDLGFDARVQLLPRLTLLSFLRYAVTEQRIVDGNLALQGQILPGLELGLLARRSAPDLFIPRYSIFSVFSQETRDEWGGFGFYRPVRWLDLSVDFCRFTSEAGSGYTLSSRITANFAARRLPRFGIEGKRFSIPADGYRSQRGGYLMARLFGVQRISQKLSAIVDASVFQFDYDLNGYPRSLSASATLGWDFLPAWRAVITGVVSETPFASHQVETLAKVVYSGHYVSTRKVD